ncbi:hypothetical protein [Loigolactobacillus coryniformis]|uniref:Uncharacterized protein n=1 Tax=Loigolactobacillus coryniformis subsp. torquens DSM 20004 = KCTC 3535 TaxID=1423822 RepID=A0A2D1KMZ2_9LACO|nr:hypothetical protein [Loigolactobacillus coryniformis]ATO43402.1 hypothetical protein LC20004_05540 [Loigolactobacillus coryniformis subsp. torquens DSM 20004 = KCTC 3535]KRK85503.1 hypothetical protein FC16_GL001459 [Loigolactobacillus coryniformis subsp. torquens DSM 20004 = KCTC 3535]
MKTKNIVTANVKLYKGKEDEFNISVPKDVTANELEFVLIRLTYFMASNYAELNKMDFELALEQYGRAMITQVGVMKDLETANDQAD